MQTEHAWSPGQRALLRFLEQQGVLGSEPAPPAGAQPSNADLFAAFADAIEQERFVELVTDALRITAVDLDTVTLMPDLLALIPPDVAIRGEVIPIAQHDGILEVVAANPLDLEMVKALEFTSGLRVRMRVAVRDDICRALALAYPEAAGEAGEAVATVEPEPPAAPAELVGSEEADDGAAAEQVGAVEMPAVVTVETPEDDAGGAWGAEAPTVETVPVDQPPTDDEVDCADAGESGSIPTWEIEELDVEAVMEDAAVAVGEAEAAAGTAEAQDDTLGSAASDEKGWTLEGAVDEAGDDGEAPREVDEIQVDDPLGTIEVVRAEPSDVADVGDVQLDPVAQEPVADTTEDMAAAIDLTPPVRSSAFMDAAPDDEPQRPTPEVGAAPEEPSAAIQNAGTSDGPGGAGVWGDEAWQAEVEEPGASSESAASDQALPEPESVTPDANRILDTPAPSDETSAFEQPVAAGQTGAVDERPVADAAVRPAVLVVSSDLGARVSVRGALEGGPNPPCVITMQSEREARAVLALGGVTLVVVDGGESAGSGQPLWQALEFDLDVGRVVVRSAAPPAGATEWLAEDATSSDVAERIRALLNRYATQ